MSEWEDVGRYATPGEALRATITDLLRRNPKHRPQLTCSRCHQLCHLVMVAEFESGREGEPLCDVCADAFDAEHRGSGLL